MIKSRLYLFLLRIDGFLLDKPGRRTPCLHEQPEQYGGEKYVEG